MTLDYYSNLTLHNRYKLVNILDSMIQADVPDRYCLSMLLELTFCETRGESNNIMLMFEGMKAGFATIVKLNQSPFQLAELSKRLAKVDRLMILYEGR